MNGDAYYPREVVVLASAWQQVHAHLLETAARQGTEAAALLYGTVVRRLDGSHATWVQSAVPTIGQAGPLIVRVEPQSFQRARLELNRRGYGDQYLVGWWHSHPGIQCRPSGEDENSMYTYFAQPWMVTLISDPLSGACACHVWRQGGKYGRIAPQVLAGDPETYLARPSTQKKREER